LSRSSHERVVCAGIAQAVAASPRPRRLDRVVSGNSIQVIWTLCGTVVIIQNATDPLTAPNRSLPIRSSERLNQLVPDALIAITAATPTNCAGFRQSTRACRVKAGES